MRKPRPIRINSYEFVAVAPDGLVDVNVTGIHAKHCEQIAAWLLKAAEWIREQEKRGGK